MVERDMTLQRMDNVLIVVDDIEAAKAFFIELGMELEGEMPVEGPWVGAVIGLDNVRCEIATLRTPDGHSRIELDKFHEPAAVRGEPKNAPVNELGIRRIMFAVDDIDDTVARLRAHGAGLLGEGRSTRASSCCATSAAPRASSSPWPSRSADASLPRGQRTNPDRRATFIGWPTRTAAPSPPDGSPFTGRCQIGSALGARS